MINTLLIILSIIISPQVFGVEECFTVDSEKGWQSYTPGNFGYILRVNSIEGQWTGERDDWKYVDFNGYTGSPACKNYTENLD